MTVLEPVLAEVIPLSPRLHHPAVSVDTIALDNLHQLQRFQPGTPWARQQRARNVDQVNAYLAARGD